MKYLVMNKDNVYLKVVEADSIEDAAWKFLDTYFITGMFDMIKVGHIAACTEVTFLSSENDASVAVYFYGWKDL